MTPDFNDLLSLVAERSAALRRAVSGLPDLTGRVPGCPEWSVRELVEHVGEVQRSWSVVVAAGPSKTPPSAGDFGGITPADDLLPWSEESTRLLLTALRAAGPGQGCWTWWGRSGAPMTAGAVARHQVQEAAVHAYDAQDAAGMPEPVPLTVAADGIPEFLSVSLGSLGAWPHPPVQIGLHTTEGDSWTLDLSPEGAVVTEARKEPAAALHGPASDLLLVLHRRAPLDRIKAEGDRGSLEDLISWPSLD